MRRARAAGIGLAVVMVLAFASGAAQAAPGSLEFGKCFAKTGGKYLNAGCTKLAKPGKENDEWEPLGAGVESQGVKERETGPAVLEATSGAKVSCTGAKQVAGEYRNMEEAGIVWLFTGCEAGGFKCNSAGDREGEVAWNPLRGEPGVVTKEPKEEKDVIGIAFSPQSGTDDAEFSCGSIPFVVRGGVVVKMQADSSGGTSGELTNKMLSKFELEFLAEQGKQVPEAFEGGSPLVPQLSIAGAAFEGATLSMILVQEASPKTTKVELRKCEVNVC
jgi:hypothetical protein